jgi:prolyl oligopeptidase
LFYTHESFTQPPAIFEYLPGWQTSRLWHRQASPTNFSPVYARNISVQSKDGTGVPAILIARQIGKTGTEAPMIMTGYGGFGVSVTPQFSVLVSIVVGLGATFTLAQIRGGSEFGKAWHDAARRCHRQTAFDDFISVAEWLCSERETTPGKLAVFGGSNSGLLVGVAMTQRPDLFRAVLCIAPLLDMVRYEHFDRAAKWQQEYGTVDREDEFHALHTYSPYHRIDDATAYPAVLFVSGDKDDRCNPAHIRKTAARLQERPVQVHPVLVDYSAERGHSASLPLSVRIEALAHRIAFLCRELNISFPAAGGPDDKACS